MGLLGTLLPQKQSAKMKDWAGGATLNYEAFFTSDCGFLYVLNNLPGIYQYAACGEPGAASFIVEDWQVEQDEAGVMLYSNILDAYDPDNGTPCYRWMVEVHYSNNVNYLDITLTGNPVDQPIEVSFQWTVYDQPVDVAITGHNDDGSYIFGAVLTSSKVPFDPSITRDQLRGSIRISQNVLSYNPVTDWFFGNSINNDTSPLWNGFAAKTIKWTPPDMPKQLWSPYMQQNYYRLDHQFNFNPQTWDALVIDRAYVGLDATTGEQYKILDINGQPASQPSLLNAGQPLYNPTPDNITVFDFQVYPDINFTTTFPRSFANIWSPGT